MWFTLTVVRSLHEKAIVQQKKVSLRSSRAERHVEYVPKEEITDSFDELLILVASGEQLSADILMAETTDLVNESRVEDKITCVSSFTL